MGKVEDNRPNEINNNEESLIKLDYNSMKENVRKILFDDDK